MKLLRRRDRGMTARDYVKKYNIQTRSSIIDERERVEREAIMGVVDAIAVASIVVVLVGTIVTLLALGVWSIPPTHVQYPVPL